MGLTSIFQRSSGRQATAATPDAPADLVQQARTRARRRLIGAVVLVATGVIGFPILFETQPRPIPVDIPIEIPRKENAPPLVMPSARPAKPAPAAPAEAGSGARTSEVATERAAAAGRDAPAPATKAAPTPPPEAAPAKTQSAAAPSAAGSSKEAGRFVVQVGAFADNAAARETRQKIEKLGLKSYTQVADTPQGNRVRVRIGPFASREEADRVQARLKAAGSPAVVITL